MNLHFCFGLGKSKVSPNPSAQMCIRDRCKQGKDSSLVKIVPQLPGCDRLFPVRREVGKPPPALLDSYTLPQQKGRKLVKAGSCLLYTSTQNVKDLLASREVENIFGATR